MLKARLALPFLPLTAIYFAYIYVLRTGHCGCKPRHQKPQAKSTRHLTVSSGFEREHVIMHPSFSCRSASVLIRSIRGRGMLRCCDYCCCVLRTYGRKYDCGNCDTSWTKTEKKRAEIGWLNHPDNRQLSRPCCFMYPVTPFLRRRSN